MATPEPKKTLSARIPIWNPGTRTDRHGNTYEFAASDLAASAAAYNPSLFKAPWVKGHPEFADPAYGQVQGLEWDGEYLYADSHQIDAEFAEDVRAGRFTRISPSFYPPDHKQNPVPGVWYLKNVGFLGAKPPSNRDIPPPEFGEADQDGAICFGPGPDLPLAEFGEAPQGGLIKKYVAQAKALLAKLETAEFSESDQPEQPAPAGTAGNHQQETAMPEEQKGADDRTAEFAERDNQLNAREQELADREKRLQQQEAEQHQAQCAEFAEGVISKYSLAPRLKPRIAAVLAATPINNDQVAEFAEGDEQKKVPVGQLLRDLIDDLANPNNQVPVGEFAAPEDQDGETTAAEFAAPDGYQVSQESAELHRKAQAYADKNGCEFIDAYKAVGGK